MTKEELEKFKALLKSFYEKKPSSNITWTIPVVKKTKGALKALETISTHVEIGVLEIAEIKPLDGKKYHWLVVDSKGNTKKF